MLCEKLWFWAKIKVNSSLKQHIFTFSCEPQYHTKHQKMCKPISFSKANLLPYNQLITPRFHIEVLILLKIAYFQEKVTAMSVPIQPQIFTEITQVILTKYLPNYIRWKWITANKYPFQCLCFLTLKLHPSFLLTTINHKSCILSHNFLLIRKICFIRKLLTKFRVKTRFYNQHW